MGDQKKFAVNNTNSETHLFSERLKCAMEQAGGFSALMRKTGLSNSAISNYLKGRVPKIDIAIRIAQACDVDACWLILGRASAPSLETRHSGCELSQSDIVDLPYYDVQASAGYGVINGNENKEFFPVSRRLLRDILKVNPTNCFVIEVSGDSMEPTIRSGDKIIIDSSQHALKDGVYVLWMNDALYVKRVVNTMHDYLIKSDNPIYDPMEVPRGTIVWGKPMSNEGLTIIGRVAYRLQPFLL